jgi:hypothetical protein
MMPKFMNNVAYGELDSFNKDILFQRDHITLEEDERSMILTAAK